MRATILVGLAAGAVAVAFACSGGGGGSTQCLQDLVGSSSKSACFSCEQSACASQLTAAQSACSGYLDCICPNSGPFVPSNVEMCAPQLTGGSCAAPEQALAACLQTHCATSCGGGSSGSMNDSGPGDSGNSEGSGGTADVSCYHAPTKTASGNCMQTNGVPATAVGTLNAECASLKGTAAAKCPTDAELMGCCVAAVKGGVTPASCYYISPGSSSTALASGIKGVKMYCSDAKETYSATVP